MLNQRNSVEELALALRTLLNPTLFSVVFALFDAVNVVFKRRDYFSPVSITRKLALTASTINPSVKLGIIDDGQQDRVRHPLGFLGKHSPLVGRST